MDFMSDTLADGRRIRVLTLIDSHTRECLTLVAGVRFRGVDVVEVLERVGRTHPWPERITVDYGTEFTSRAVDAWAYWRHVQLDFSRPGKPVDNCLIEAFNGSLRRECLSQHWFASLVEAQQILEAWRVDYNKTRPHQSFGGRTPYEYLRGDHFIPGPNRLVVCTS
jgi:putative transposase